MTACSTVLLALAIALASPKEVIEPGPTAKLTVSTKGTDLWVGQKVIIVVDLSTPGYFANAVAFDLPQVPGVILYRPEGNPVVGTETRDGVSCTTQRHELTAYAQRAGQITIPPFLIRFESTPAFGKPTVDQRVNTTAVSFVAKLPPGAEGLATVVTTRDLTLKESWSPVPGTKQLTSARRLRERSRLRHRTYRGWCCRRFHYRSKPVLLCTRKLPVVEDKMNRGDLLGRRATVTYIVKRRNLSDAGTFTGLVGPCVIRKLQRATLPAHTIEVAALSKAAETSPTIAATNRSSFRWGLPLLLILSVLIAAWLLPAINSEPGHTSQGGGRRFRTGLFQGLSTRQQQRKCP